MDKIREITLSRLLQASRDNPTLPYLFLLGVVLSLFRPAEVPSLFFDEGWNLTVARNWIELGHYGPLLNGQPVPPSILSVGFPGVLPLALSFKLFGIGTLQARLPGILFTACAIFLLCYLAGGLFNRRVAAGTLGVLLLMAIRPDLHPVLVGRQAMGEMPALFYLLAGYACFLSDGPERLGLRPFAALFWGLALMTKPQVIPFLVLALLLPLLLALSRRLWKSACLFSLGLFGSLAVLVALIWFQQRMLHDPMPPAVHIYSWSGTTALVPMGLRRFWVLRAMLLLTLPLIAGLLYAVMNFAHAQKDRVLTTERWTLKLSFFILCGSWFSWYVLFSIGWMRYLFPAAFLGAIFVSALLCDLTNQFDLKGTLREAASVFLRLRFNRRAITSLLVSVLTGWSLILTAHGLYQAYSSEEGKSPLRVASFLNAETPPDAVIESVEADLYFLLDRRYHYISNDVQMRLNRRTFLRENVAIAYDPLEADPDYLVVGPMASLWNLYGETLKRGFWGRVQVFDGYEIYRRKR